MNPGDEVIIYWAAFFFVLAFAITFLQNRRR